MSIYIVDFEDSFTLNIFSEFKAIDQNIAIEIHSYHKMEKLLTKLIHTEKKCILVLGPGPGHPNQHRNINSYLTKILKNSNVFVFAICLGHQLIGQFYGFEVKNFDKPVHGEAVSYHFDSEFMTNLNIDPQEKLLVQRYNSLYIADSNGPNKLRYFSEKGEIVSFYSERLLTTQFHPESIGTTCPNYFFKHVLNFLV